MTLPKGIMLIKLNWWKNTGMFGNATAREKQIKGWARKKEEAQVTSILSMTHFTEHYRMAGMKII